MAKSGMSDVESEEEENNTTQSSSESDMNVQGPPNHMNAICKPVKASTPVSILIESLVKNLCSVYESDGKKADQIYNLICSKLYQMKLIDESFSMIEFEGMRNQYQRALYSLVRTAVGVKQLNPSLESFLLNNDVTNDWSHYRREFDEIEYIAGGGFGQVFRVKHKLDGTEYAVKKIFIRSEGIKSVRDYLSEVKTFACLNHSHIVQYKAAWLELGASTSNNSIIGQSDSEIPIPTENETDNYSENENHDDDYIYPSAISETETVFAEIKTVGDTSDFEVNFESSTKTHQYSHSSNSVLETDRKMICKSNRIKRNSISEGGNAICRVEEIHDLHIQAKVGHSKWATLYIQMALCQSTLKQWIEKRNETEKSRNYSKESALVPRCLNQVHTDTVIQILKQILRGIEYIHSKNIVHHDIKPSNIFIQIENGQLLVQLGDFGLACPLQSARHSLAFGTKLYSAPEQLSGKCSSMSDMYSLGIVLLELVETFSTDMERIHTITELRKGNLPEHLPKQQPQLASVISQLVAKQPTDRPDATTLLQKITVNVSESNLVQELRCQLAEKDEEISRLKEMLKNAGLKSV